jgi:hypothetical protein
MFRRWTWQRAVLGVLGLVLLAVMRAKDQKEPTHPVHACYEMPDCPNSEAIAYDSRRARIAIVTSVAIRIAGKSWPTRASAVARDRARG